jgi:hypothetical protein
LQSETFIFSCTFCDDCTSITHLLSPHSLVPSIITRQVLQWNPQGKRGRGRPRNTWRRDFIAEMEIEGYRWQDLERKAQNRTRWRTVVTVCALSTSMFSFSILPQLGVGWSFARALCWKSSHLLKLIY